MRQYHLVYDNNCPICLKAIDGIRKLDQLGLVNPVPLDSLPENPRPGFPSRQKLKEQIHMITPEGRVYRGADAVGVLATLFPRSRLLGKFLLLPGIRSVARYVYRMIARHRLRISRLALLN